WWSTPASHRVAPPRFPSSGTTASKAPGAAFGALLPGAAPTGLPGVDPGPSVLSSSDYEAIPSVALGWQREAPAVARGGGAVDLERAATREAAAVGDGRRRDHLVAAGTGSQVALREVL